MITVRQVSPRRVGRAAAQRTDAGDHSDLSESRRVAGIPKWRPPQVRNASGSFGPHSLLLDRLFVGVGVCWVATFGNFTPFLSASFRESGSDTLEFWQTLMLELSQSLHT